MIVAILNSSQFASTGRVASAVLRAFLVYLCVGGLFSFLLGSFLIDLLPENSGKALDSISVDVASVSAPREAQTFGNWMNSLIPS